MAKVKFQVTEEDVEQAGKDLGDFAVPKPGYYVLQAKEINHGWSKDDDGKEDKKRPRLECVFEIVGVGAENAPVEENYGNVWDYVSFSKEAGWKRAQFLKAFGVSDGSGTFNVETDELVGMKVLGRLTQQKGRNPGDEPRARLRTLLPYEDADEADAFGDTEEEEEGEEEEYYTDEYLRSITTKELGAAAQEFDIDPNEYVSKVRGKTKVDIDGLIAAILEAQAAPEDEEEEGDDEESPF